MISQKVLLTLGGKSVDVDATYELKNDGPTGYFRIGVPEEARGFAEVRREDEVAEAAKIGVRAEPFRGFEFFSLFVDNIAVETSSESAGPARTYRTKLVQLWRGKTHFIHVLYRTPVGSGASSSGGELLQAGYELTPDAGWKGSIGTCEVLAQWRTPRVGTPIKPVSISSRGVKSGFDLATLAKLPLSNIYYRGFAVPSQIASDTLRFVARNFLPVDHHALRFYFGYMPHR
jgi:hypothetical protein